MLINCPLIAYLLPIKNTERIITNTRILGAHQRPKIANLSMNFLDEFSTKSLLKWYSKLLLRTLRMKFFHWLQNIVMDASRCCFSFHFFFTWKVAKQEIRYCLYPHKIQAHHIFVVWLLSFYVWRARCLFSPTIIGASTMLSQSNNNLYLLIFAEALRRKVYAVIRHFPVEEKKKMYFYCIRSDGEIVSLFLKFYIWY